MAHISGNTSGGSLSGKLSLIGEGATDYHGIDLTDLVHGTEVVKIVSLSQEDYDELPIKDRTILYVVGG